MVTWYWSADNLISYIYKVVRTRDDPPQRYPGRGNFKLISWQNQQPVSGGRASCLASAGRVTLASGTTFFHINAFARLTGTTLGMVSVT